MQLYLWIHKVGVRDRGLGVDRYLKHIQQNFTAPEQRTSVGKQCRLNPVWLTCYLHCCFGRLLQSFILIPFLRGKGMNLKMTLETFPKYLLQRTPCREARISLQQRPGREAAPEHQ